MRKKINDREIRALPTPTREQRQCDHWDVAMRGFGVRVSYGGKRVFVVRYRVSGRLRRMTLGPYPAMTLKEARRKAKEVLGSVAVGEDPAEEKVLKREGLRFRDLSDKYLEMVDRRFRSAAEERRMINKDLLPALGWKLLIDIKRRDVRDLVERIAFKRGAPIMANRVLGVLSRMFNFALDREWIEANPAARMKEPGKEVSRERVLNDEEIRALWIKLEEIRWADTRVLTVVAEGDAPVPPPRNIARATAEAFQVQLLTGQRPGEVRGMRWEDVDFEGRWWILPPHLTKNGKAHRVPLTDAAMDIIETRREEATERSEFVFENKDGAGSVLHRGKKAAAIVSKQLPFAFRAHDLRRTVATRMAASGVTREHIARVLNHVEGGPAATRVYDRYDYDAEKRNALDRWAQRLTAIIDGKTAKVVSMRSR